MYLIYIENNQKILCKSKSRVLEIMKSVAKNHLKLGLPIPSMRYEKC